MAMSSRAEHIEQAVSAAKFYLDWPGAGKIALSEITNISSKVNPSEYIYNDHMGNTVHTKQFGKTDPPMVTVKRALDSAGNVALLGLHAVARQGKRSAVGAQVSLVALDASGATAAEYILKNAWVSELVIHGLKAGDSGVAMIEAKIICEEILSNDVAGVGQSKV